MWGKERKGTKQGEARGMRLPNRYELNNKLLALFKWALLRVLMSILLLTSFPQHFPLLWVLSSSQRTCPLYTCVHLKPPSLQPTQKKRREAGILVHTCTCSLSFGPGTDADLIHPLTPQQKHDLTLRQSQSNSESIKMCPYSARERNDSLMHNHTATQSHIHSLKCSCILQYGLCCL